MQTNGQSKISPFARSFNWLRSLITKKNLRAELARNAVGSLTLKLVYTALSFAVGVTLARLLGAEGYGIYAYVFALVSLLSIPAEFGLPNLVVRETAKALARQEWGAIQGVWRWAGKIVAILTATLVLGAGVVVVIWGDRFSREQLVTFSWGLALVPLIALGDLRGAALRGLNRVIQGQLTEQALLPGFYFLFILGTAFFLSTGNLTPAMAMSLQVLAAALAFAIGSWLLWRATPLEVRRAKPVSEGRRWLASTLPLAFIGGMQLINHRTSILILGLFADSAQVGIYRVADQMSTLVSLGLFAINMVAAPQFARLYALGDMARLQRVATASARVVLSLTLPVVVIFLLFGKPLLKLIFGTEFVPAYSPLTILSLGQLVNSAMGSVAFLLNMTGHEQDTARGMVVAAVANIVLNLVLVPLWGLKGAALASAVTLTAWNVLLWLAVRRRLKINSMAFDLF
ncbi:MAG: flippase [Anaerolineales bacterium]|nr:flippase [Anaerolineales bacterium]